jgi:putative ABC transport system ATP-binding protein
LNIIAGIDKPSSGTVSIGSEEITSMNEQQITRLRRDKIGFVFQFFNLLNTLTVFENASLPLALSGTISPKEIRTRTEEILEQVGLAKRANFYPSQLSGGEMQRVAIARAVVHKPEVIVADEPTGNLDSENGEHVLQLFQSLCRLGRHTTIMATHSTDAAAHADRVLSMRDGRLIELQQP